jgi:hypothetical protein
LYSRLAKVRTTKQFFGSDKISFSKAHDIFAEAPIEAV